MHDTLTWNMSARYAVWCGEILHQNQGFKGIAQMRTNMNHHDEYEPETTGPDIFRGCIYGLLLCAPFWLTLIGIVWLANKYIGGG